MALAPSAVTWDEAQALQLAERVGARWGRGSLSEPWLRPHTRPWVPAPTRFCSWDGPRLHFSTSLFGVSSVNWGVWFLLSLLNSTYQKENIVHLRVLTNAFLFQTVLQYLAFSLEFIRLQIDNIHLNNVKPFVIARLRSCFGHYID